MRGAITPSDCRTGRVVGRSLIATYCGICVVLPLPVSPITTMIWLELNLL